jgi:hypothetical protein
MTEDLRPGCRRQRFCHCLATKEVQLEVVGRTTLVEGTLGRPGEFGGCANSAANSPRDALPLGTLPRPSCWGSDHSKRRYTPAPRLNCCKFNPAKRAVTISGTPAGVSVCMKDLEPYRASHSVRAPELRAGTCLFCQHCVQNQLPCMLISTNYNSAFNIYQLGICSMQSQGPGQHYTIPLAGLCCGFPAFVRQGRVAPCNDWMNRRATLVILHRCFRVDMALAGCTDAKVSLAHGWILQRFGRRSRRARRGS